MDAGGQHLKQACQEVNTQIAVNDESTNRFFTVIWKIPIFMPPSG
jgi:hypothetical protein